MFGVGRFRGNRLGRSRSICEPNAREGWAPGWESCARRVQQRIALLILHIANFKRNRFIARGTHTLNP
jgi:hypothetical protein